MNIFNKIKESHEIRDFLAAKTNYKIDCTQLKTSDWWISRLMLDPLFSFISRLT